MSTAFIVIVFLIATTPILASYGYRRLELYQKCPRRFFYTHVLGLGGARKATAFARTHDCLYELIRWMSQARLEGDSAEADAEAAFESIWPAAIVLNCPQTLVEIIRLRSRWRSDRDSNS